jgi:hypothetical protein
MAVASASACEGEKTRPGRETVISRRSSSSMRRLPSKFTMFRIGYSSTRMTSRLPAGMKSTDRKKPVAETR